MANYLLDTNVFHNTSIGEIFKKYEGSKIIIPMVVLEELENQKDRDGIVGFKARSSIRDIYEIKKYGNLNDFVKLDKDIFIKIEKEFHDNLSLRYDKIDDIIIGCLSYCNAKHDKTILVTDDIAMALKAESLGFETVQIAKDKISIYDGYTGVKIIDINSIPESLLASHYENSNENIFGLNENEYLILQENGIRKGEIKRWNNEKFHRLKYKDFVVSPKDDLQACALDLLCNRDVPIKIITGKFGAGKAQPLYSKILTPNGFVEMRDIKKGSVVIGEDGNPTNVLEVFPQGEKKNYRITFHDGTFTDCCDEHLWKYKTNSMKVKDLPYRVKSLKEIMQNHKIKDKNGSKNIFIPLCEPVNFKENIHEIDPYLLGVLLGDGFLSNGNSVAISTSEDDIVEKVRGVLPKRYVIKKQKGENYSWNIVHEDGLSHKKNDRHIKDMLNDLGLKHIKSKDKFIPKEYLIDSVENRKKLLAGLFDTDGSVGDKIRMSYSTTSSQLKDDIIWLSQSLGIRATYHIDSRNENLCYNIIFHTNEKIFSSKKHNERYEKNNISLKRPHKYNDLKIEKIEYIGMEDMQCILVDNKSHLYLTDSFIVTHNTFLSVQQLFKDFKDGKYTKLVMARQADGDTDSLSVGFLKGHYDEKIEPFFKPIIDNLGFDAYALEAMKAKGEIEFEIPYYLKGRSFNGDVAVYVDECEDLTLKTLKLIGSRIGQNEKGESGAVVFAGDFAQTEKKYQKDNGLLYLISKTKHHPLVGYVNLEVDYRSEASKVFADL